MHYDDVNLDTKIGQLIVSGFHGTDANCAEMIAKGHIGNVILFSRNIRSAEQTARLTAGLQEACMKANGLPAFIAADQECGSVDRFQGSITSFPGNMAVAAAADTPEEVTGMGKMLGEELRALGFHIDFAPCMDVICNPLNTGIGVRSYSADPRRAAVLGSAMLKGLEQGGVIGCAKHFPGSGDTSVDAHRGLPVLSHDLVRLEWVELLPFRHAIQNGCPMVMAGHLITECIDREHPASVSETVITGYLRGQLGFNGLVITDCLEMGAITNRYGTAKAAVMALQAGADMVCISHTLARQLEAAEAIKSAIKEGRLSLERVDEAFHKVMKAKEKAGLFEYNAVTDIQTIRMREHLDFARSLYARSTAVLEGTWSIPAADETIVAGPTFQTGNPAEDEPKTAPDFAKTVGEALHSGYLRFDQDIDETQIDVIVKGCMGYSTVVLGMTEAGVHESQRELYRRLAAVGKRILAVSLRTPYDLDGEARPVSHLCTFEFTNESLAALSDLIKGKNEPRGKIPKTFEGRS